VTAGKSKLRLRLQTAPSLEDPGAFRNPDAPRPPLANRPSFAVYKAYTHVGPFFAPAQEERQAEPFAWGPPRERPEDYGSIEERLMERARADIEYSVRYDVLGSDYSAGLHRRQTRILHGLALIYHTEWSGHHEDPVLLERIRDAIDIHVKRQAAQGGDPGTMYYRGWMSHGNLALTYSMVHGAFEAAGWLQTPLILATPSGTRTLDRRQAYADFFHDAFEWRRQDRRHYTNQPVYINRSLYRLQTALRALGDPRALTEAQALRYLHEATGLAPLRSREFGIDGADANFPFYTITEKGLTRELGYVDHYGELSNSLIPLYVESGCPLIKAQLQKFVRTRSIFRLPANDAEGYRCLRGIGFISWRTPNYPFRIAYAGIEEAAILEDPHALRLAELEIEHGRPYLWAAEPTRDTHWYPADSIRMVEHYRKVKAMAPSAVRLAMEPDQPNFAWGDEQVGVFAFRDGASRVYGSFWNNDEAAGRAIGDQGLLRFIRPDYDRLVEFVPESSTPPSGQFLSFDFPFGTRTYEQAPLPPGYDAWQELPPNAIDRRAGLAYFYRLEYGDYLIAMNTTQPDTYRESTYQLEIPEGVTLATDLASGKSIDLSQPIEIGPATTRVLRLTRD
jgi:hypothetical protein